MTRQQRRIQIITSCLEQQKQLAATAKQEMESAQQQSNEYGANVDRYDSYRTKMMRSRDMYAKQLSNANAGIRVLQELINLPPFEKAEHGAIVITDKQRFFLSIGAGKFVVNDPESPTGMHYYFAISAQTPIYLAIKGKTTGDNFIVNGIAQTIKEVF